MNAIFSSLKRSIAVVFSLIAIATLVGAYTVQRTYSDRALAAKLEGEPFFNIAAFYGELESLLLKGSEAEVSEGLQRISDTPFIRSVTVLDNTGQILHRYPQQALAPEGVNVFLELTARAVKVKAIVKHYLRERRELYSAAPVLLPGGINGGVVIEYDFPLLSEAVHDTQAQGWYFTIASVLSALLAAYLFIRYLFTGRLAALNRVVSQLSRGRWETTAPEGGDEIGQLGTALNLLAQGIKQAYGEHREYANRLQGVLDHSPAIIYLKDTEGRFLLANAKCREHIHGGVIGLTSEQVNGDSLLSVFAEYEERLRHSRHSHQVQLEVPRDKDELVFLFTMFPLLDDNGGELLATCVIATDITSMRANEKALEVARNIFETTNEGIIVTNKDNRIVDVNNAFELITGYKKGEALGADPAILTSHRHTKEFFDEMWSSIQTQGSWSGEIWNRRKSGEIYPQWLAIKSLHDKGGEPSGYFGVFTDITLQKKTEKELRSLAYFDPLTQLANRALLKDRLQQDINYANRENKKLAVFFLDLDRFKQINDTLGHDQGDRLLVQVAKRIMSVVRSTDTVARLAGDEFVVVLPGVTDQHKVDVFGNKLLSIFDKPFELEGKAASVGVSCGISIYPEDGATIEELMRNADAAMYKAKEQGRGRKVYFDQSINIQLVAKMKLRQSLDRALANNEFEMHYQSIVNLKNTDIESAEALIRWKLPNGKMVPPLEFIQAAEDMDMIIPIGDWVLLAVFGQVKKLRESGIFNHRVAINLSPKQLKQKNFIEKIKRMLVETKVRAEWFAFEVTETTVIEDMEHTVHILQQLREVGFSLELDDFGTGYSSLEHIKKLPIDVVKIDRSFIHDLNDSDKSMSIVGNVISMAHSQGDLVVAEGVETEQQVKLLKFLGCDMVQGFYFHKPEPFDEWCEHLSHYGHSV